MSDKLPLGWATAPLATIAEINPRHIKSLDDSLPISFARMAALSESKPEFESLEERTLGEVRKGFTHFAEGDVLFAKITPCMENGKGAVARGLRNKLGCGTTEIHVVRPLADISSEYIYRFLAQDRVRRAAKENFTGTAGQARVPTSFIEELELPLAPLAEQQRIVAKLETLLGKVNASQQRLAKIPVLLKRFRQSVLAAACSGRLTADWRDAGSTDDVEIDTDLPQSWNSPEFGEIISDGPQNGLYKPASFYGTGTFIVRIDAFYDGTIAAWGELKRVRLTEKELSQFALRNDDILVNRVNSPKFLGKCALVRKLKEPCVYESNMMRLRLDTSRALPDYAILYLQSLSGLVELRENAKHAINQSSINQEDVKATRFNLPPLSEQQEIVRRVEALFALADQIEARFQNAKKQVDKLTPSLLARAFAGKLVPQDPADEPAAKLLERLAAAKGA